MNYHDQNMNVCLWVPRWVRADRTKINEIANVNGADTQITRYALRVQKHAYKNSSNNEQ